MLEYAKFELNTFNSFGDTVDDIPNFPGSRDLGHVLLVGNPVRSSVPSLKLIRLTLTKLQRFCCSCVTVSDINYDNDDDDDDDDDKATKYNYCIEFNMTVDETVHIFMLTVAIIHQTTNPLQSTMKSY